MSGVDQFPLEPFDTHERRPKGINQVTQQMDTVTC